MEGREGTLIEVLRLDPYNEQFITSLESALPFNSDWKMSDDSWFAYNLTNAPVNNLYIN